MSDGKGLLARLLTRITPQFFEDWLGKSGERWRVGVKKAKELSAKYDLSEKADAAPELLWKAAEGAATLQHAQAQKAYAEAENIRIKTELERRTMDSSVDKTKADAELARINVLAARIELFKKLKDAGVMVSGDPLTLDLYVSPAQPTPPLQIEDVLTQDEVELTTKHLVYLKCSTLRVANCDCVITWNVSIGSRVDLGELLGTLELTGSPATTLAIVAPVFGTVTSLKEINVPTVVSVDEVIGAILTAPP